MIFLISADEKDYTMDERYTIQYMKRANYIYTKRIFYDGDYV